MDGVASKLASTAIGAKDGNREDHQDHSGGLAGGEWIWDATVKGFGARRQRDGVFYYLRYRQGGAQRMKSIGRHGSPWTPDTARRQATTALGKVAAGVDPFAEAASGASG